MRPMALIAQGNNIVHLIRPLVGTVYHMMRVNAVPVETVPTLPIVSSETGKVNRVQHLISTIVRLESSISRFISYIIKSVL
jgi:hypothetical protein